MALLFRGLLHLAAFASQWPVKGVGPSHSPLLFLLVPQRGKTFPRDSFGIHEPVSAVFRTLVSHRCTRVKAWFPATQSSLRVCSVYQSQPFPRKASFKAIARTQEPQFLWEETKSRFFLSLGARSSKGQVIRAWWPCSVSPVPGSGFRVPGSIHFLRLYDKVPRTG